MAWRDRGLLDKRDYAIVGLIGAVIARFRPNGMARALFATALAQALVQVIALVIWNPQVTSWAPECCLCSV